MARAAGVAAVAAAALAMAAGAGAAPPTIAVVTPAELAGSTPAVVRVDATVPAFGGSLGTNTSIDAPCDPRGPGAQVVPVPAGPLSVTREVFLPRPGVVRFCASVLAGAAPPPGEVAEIAITARAERPPTLTLALLAAPSSARDYAIRLTVAAELPKGAGFLLTRGPSCPPAWPPQTTKDEQIAARIAYPGIRTIAAIGGSTPPAVDLSARISTPGPTLACGYVFPVASRRTVLAAAALPFAVTGKALTTLTTEVRTLGARAAVVRARLITGKADGGLFGRTPPGRCLFVPDNRPIFGPPEKTIRARVKRLFGPKSESRSEGVCGASLDRGTGRPRPWRVRFVPADPRWRAAAGTVAVAGLGGR